jgi:hypothetical protein
MAQRNGKERRAKSTERKNVKAQAKGASLEVVAVGPYRLWQARTAGISALRAWWGGQSGRDLSAEAVRLAPLVLISRESRQGKI